MLGDGLEQGELALLVRAVDPDRLLQHVEQLRLDEVLLGGLGEADLVPGLLVDELAGDAVDRAVVEGGVKAHVVARDLVLDALDVEDRLLRDRGQEAALHGLL